MLFEDNLLLKIPTFVFMSPTEMWLPCRRHTGRQVTAEQTGADGVWRCCCRNQAEIYYYIFKYLNQLS